MSKSDTTIDWRQARRQSARQAIVDAAWDLVHQEGLSALSLRDLAHRAGITTPTVYAYFDSKIAIYDAMFGQAAAQFAEAAAEPFDSDDPHEILVASVHRFFDFCTSDPVRYQLLFQRTLPGFDPSPESYAPAQRALASAQECLALNAITDTRHLDMWTALLTGLVDQQVSNDPGGDRWTRLTEEVVTMFLSYCETTRASRRPTARPTRTKGARS